MSSSLTPKGGPPPLQSKGGVFFFLLLFETFHERKRKKEKRGLPIHGVKREGKVVVGGGRSSPAEFVDEFIRYVKGKKTHFLPPSSSSDPPIEGKSQSVGRSCRFQLRPDPHVVHPVQGEEQCVPVNIKMIGA